MECRKGLFTNYLNVFIFVFFAVIGLQTCKPLSAHDNFTNNPDFHYNVLLHDLDVEIDVFKHSISAKDKLQIVFSHDGVGQIAFLLNENLKVKSIKLVNSNDLLKWHKNVARERIQKIVVVLPDSVKKSAVIEVEYEGVIYDPVITAQELGHLRGDVTAGLISENGVYLSNSSYWYPIIYGNLSLFNMTTKIVDPYRIVTQGELKERVVKDGFAVSRWESHVPADGLALVGGEYIVRTKTVDGVKVSSYFFEKDDAMSGLFVDAAVDYLKIYSKLLGPYPYKKFDVVENFFSTGYGMPSYTLLGSYVIMRGRGSLHPGYLDHEIVHSWFGNYVFNDAIKGNWVEALTTYCANYYYKELKMSPEDALKHRENASLKYSIRVQKDIEYAVNKFVTKTKESDNEIGYTKGSMVFHQLRKIIGDDAFFKALKVLVKRFGGKYAEWVDLQGVFEDVSKQNLGWFFKQWVEIKGAPELKLNNVKMETEKEGYLVKGSVLQGDQIYKLKVPIHISTVEGDKVFHLDMNAPTINFEYKVEALPTSVAIDPEYHVFRRFAPADITPCLNALLEVERGNKYFVYPSKGNDAEKNIYKGLVQSAQGRTGGILISDAEISPKVIKGSVFIAGNARNHELLGGLFNNLPKEVKLSADSFSINGEEFKGPEYALLFSFRNPFDKSNFVTSYFGLSSDAVIRARYIFFYGWNSYVVFKNGRPVIRGSFKEGVSETVNDLKKSMTGAIKSENIMEHIKFLASEKLEGRYAGSKGDSLAQGYIKDQFVQNNITPIQISGNKPFEQQFNFSITDIKDFKMEFQKKKIN